MSSDAEPLDDDSFKAELTALIPHLRAFARSLTNNAAAMDDLAQNAMLKAWNARASFVAGSNMKAWAFTILRNQFYSDKRQAWRSQPLEPGVAEETMQASDNPEDNMELLAVQNALQFLPDEQREALILVGAGGLSYEEAADVCGCAVGTIKSRVNRSRKALVEILESSEASYSSDDNLRGTDAFENIMQEANDLVNARP